MNVQAKILLFFFTIAIVSCKAKENPETVSVLNRQILVNNEPYIIKGICYHPVPKGSETRSFETLNQDLALMQEAGINTIRVYAPIDDVNVLNTIHNSGIKIISGVGDNQDGFFDMLSGSFIDYINKYKNHPSILMWELGNEYNYHPQWFDGDLKKFCSA